jgi:hypothetical protein
MKSWNKSGLFVGDAAGTNDDEHSHASGAVVVGSDTT